VAPDVVVDAGVIGRRRTGDETYVREVLTELGRRDLGFRIVAVVNDSESAPEGVTGVVLPAGSQFTRLAWQLPRLLRSLRGQLAHFQYIVPPLYTGPAVVTVHDMSFELLPELEDPLDGWALRRLVPMSVRRARLVFTVSEWTKRDILRRYDLAPDRVIVTSNGVGKEFRPDGPRPSRPPYMLFVGALRPRKDPVTAFEAFLRVADLGMQFVMIGPDKGLYRRLRATIERHGAEDRVEIRGYVSREELAAMYRGAECLVLPSMYEGFGLPVIEAMASGTPVVATTVGAIPEIAGDAAVLVPPRDPASLAEGIRTAFEQRTQLAIRGLNRAKLFSWDEVAGRIADGYKSIL